MANQNHLYSSYMSHLDSLVFDSIVESRKPSDIIESEANLALWTNAQFTYDIQPGAGILDDKSTQPSPMLTADSSPSNTSISYENLANYLDYELPQQQQHLQQPIQPQQQQVRGPHQHLLLPKIVPAMTLEEITKALFTTTTAPNSLAAASTAAIGVKRPAAAIEKKKEPAEEDKRRRNTAASARFRIKKKMREQTAEKTVKEMTEKSNGLENRVKELEMEIKWLRGLLIEKNNGSSIPSTPSSSTAPTEESDKIKEEEPQQL